MNLTLIIPTKNRYKEVKKLISYYEKFNYEGNIFFIDSSNENIFFRTQKYIKKLKNKKIKYFRYIGRPFECTKYIQSKIRTEFVCWSGDDDYYIISGLKKSIKILTKNKKILALNSLSLVANFQKNNSYSYTIYENFHSDQPKAINRLSKILNKYRVPIFSVFRTKIFNTVLKYIPGKKNRNLCPTRIIHDEYFLSFLFILFSNIKNYNFPYLIRTVPPKKYAKDLTKERPLSNDDIKSFEYVKKTIIKILKKKVDQEIFKREFTKFINNMDKKKSTYSVFLELKKMYYNKIYVRFNNKKLDTFLKAINWLRNN